MTSRKAEQDALRLQAQEVEAHAFQRQTKSDREDLQQKLTVREQELDTARQLYEDLKQDLELEKDGRSVAIVTQRRQAQELEELKQTIASVQCGSERRAQQIQELEVRCKTVEAEREQLADDLQQVKVQSDRLTTELEEKGRLTSGLNADNLDLSASKQSLAAECASLQSRCNDLQSQSEAAEDRQSDLEDQLAESRKCLARQLEDHDRAFEAQQQREASLTAEIDSLRQHERSLGEELEAGKKQTKETSFRLQQAEERIHSLEADILGANVHLEQVTAEWSAQAQVLKADIERKEEEACRLRNAISETESKLQGHVDKLQSTLQQVRPCPPISLSLSGSDWTWEMECQTHCIISTCVKLSFSSHRLVAFSPSIWSHFC